MSDVIRVFVEKREGFDVEARAMLADLRDNLGLKEIRELRLLNRYDVEGLSPEDFMRVRGIVVSEPNVDDAYDETFVLSEGWRMFAMEYLPGQYEQRADSAATDSAAARPAGERDRRDPLPADSLPKPRKDPLPENGRSGKP